MNARLERAVRIARSLSQEEQDEIASAMLGLMGADDDREPYRLTEEDKAAIDRSRAQAARGEFATEAEVEAVFAKFRR
jgi:hypothetical protein